MSLMDTAYTKTGTRVPEPNETYIMFVTETDVFNTGLPVYHVERIIEETGERFDDKGHIVYVNGAYVGEDPIGVLMHDFRCSDPNKMLNEMLRERVGELKGSPEWRETMCQAMEDTRTEGRNEVIFELLHDGDLTREKAVKRANMTPDDFDKAYALYESMLLKQ